MDMGLRRGIAAALCFLAAAICVWACAPAAADAEPVRLRLIAWKQDGADDLWECYRIAEEYSASHPGVKIDMTHDSWDNARDYLTRWGGSWRQYAPDMTVIPDEWVADFAPNLITLGAAGERLLAPFVPAVVAPLAINGHIHGVPWQMESWCLYYRPDLLPEGCSVPTTWDELLACATETAAGTDDVYGLGLPGAERGGGAHRLLMLLWGAGGSLHGEAGDLDFVSKEAVEALDFYVRLARSGALQPEVLSWDSAGLEDAFARGRVAMVIADSHFGPALKSAAPKLQFAVAPLPTRERPFAAVASTCLVMLRTTNHRRECTDFIRYVASEQAQYRLWKSGAVPCHEVVVAAARTDPELGAFTAHLDNAFARPGLMWRDVEAMLDDAIFFAVSGRCSPAEALQAVQERYVSAAGPTP